MKVVVNQKNNMRAVVNSSGLRRLSDLLDVDLTLLEDGSLLIYNATTNKFVSSRELEKQNINGGHF
jgi:hypothetical protein